MLSQRLLALADFITDSRVVADIGSDHALLLCHLAKHHNLEKGYAFDIATGPLVQARKNCLKNGVTNIECIQAAGLSLLPKGVTTVIIAGLGYKTIRKILEDDWDKLTDINEIIVQCNSQIIELRAFLSDRQVNIIDEKWIKDYKDYQFIKFNLKKARGYSPAERFFGPVFLQERPVDFLRYYANHCAKLHENYRLSKREKIKQELDLIEGNLKQFF